MSTTIGIGLAPMADAAKMKSLTELAAKFDYGISAGLDAAEQGVRNGIASAMKIEKWDGVCLLRAPQNQKAQLAFGIHQELYNWEVSGEEPKFVAFLKDFEQGQITNYQKVALFFAGDWVETDKVRYSYGSVERLISLLSLPGSWCIRFLNPLNGVKQDTDEFPMIFDVSIPAK